MGTELCMFNTLKLVKRPTIYKPFDTIGATIMLQDIDCAITYVKDSRFS